MIIFNRIDDIRINFRSAVTIGTFDGVHRGHQHVLEALNLASQECGCQSVLVTFHPHPKMVVRPELASSLRFLTTPDEKIEQLTRYPLKAIANLPFTKEFSQMPYYEFIEEVLVKRLNVGVMVIGHDHAFGRNREGHYEELREFADKMGFQVRRVPPLLVEGEPISSTRIRKLLEKGKIEAANDLMGRPYSLRGTVVHGDGRGTQLGFPTANIRVDYPQKLIPGNGVYAIDVKIANQRYQGMMNIGNRPTFNHDPLTLEAHLFKFFGSIYGEKIEVFFKQFIRREIKFRNKEELVKQLIKDKETCINS
ncbi:MAG: bifunctional riboflavin kinase/FAD synthetase [Calditrichia bacterium]